MPQQPTDPRFRIENGSDGKPAFLEFLDSKGVPARVDLHARYIEPAPYTGESYFWIVPFTPSGEQLKGSSLRSEG